jgi:hypothetical protein
MTGDYGALMELQFTGENTRNLRKISLNASIKQILHGLPSD